MSVGDASLVTGDTTAFPVYEFSLSYTGGLVGVEIRYPSNVSEAGGATGGSTSQAVVESFLEAMGAWAAGEYPDATVNIFKITQDETTLYTSA